jgi:hypothetical protein
MPRGDKSSYADKQKRQAEHIEEGYEHRGVAHGEAERRAWATVNKERMAESAAAPAEARLRIMRRHEKVDGLAARRRPAARPRRARSPPRRPLAPGTDERRNPIVAPPV